MADNRKAKDTSQYVQGSLYILNTFLLGCHLFFLIFFKYIGAEVLHYVNYLSVATYIVTYYVIRFGKPQERGFVSKSVASIIYDNCF